MKFIDEASITVQSGSGGAGCVSFRRERFVPRGGPDGGDGGRGGHILLKAAAGRRTLYPFRFTRQFKAPNGKGGQGGNRTGGSGKDLVIEVPPGTQVTDAETGELLVDFTRAGEPVVIAGGGRGGQGNARFKSSTNRAPRFAQPGEDGVRRNLRLELKSLADIGIMGFPNAGKSTLIRTISAARPKVAAYPFTTLTPTLGVVRSDDGEPFVVADIPGLIRGAHTGAGLGSRFLRHIERTRLLVHLIDASEIDADDPLSRYRAINAELASYSRDLARKPQLVVLNKMDLPGADVAAELMEITPESPPFMCISAAASRGVRDLIRKMARMLDELDRPAP